MITENEKSKIVQECLNLLESKGIKYSTGLQSQFKRIEVEYSNKMTSKAGSAIIYNVQSANPIFKIKLSNVLLDTKEKELSTFYHELAHIFTNVYYKQNCKHDYPWIRFMGYLNQPADKFHHYEVKRRTVTKNYCLLCKICGFSFECTARRINSKYSYACPKCKSVLEKVRK